MTYQIAIIGASGYTGAELIRLVAEHPSMKIKHLIANSKAGQSIEQVFPHLRHLELPDLVTVPEVDFSSVDLAFCALPHKTSQEVISVLPKSLKIVDLSADFRLRDVNDYEKWYGNPHSAPREQAEAVYGLTEFYREDIRIGRLVAGSADKPLLPQCYPRSHLFHDRLRIRHNLIKFKSARCVTAGNLNLAGRGYFVYIKFAPMGGVSYSLAAVVALPVGTGEGERVLGSPRRSTCSAVKASPTVVVRLLL